MYFIGNISTRFASILYALKFLLVQDFYKLHRHDVLVNSEILIRSGIYIVCISSLTQLSRNVLFLFQAGFSQCAVEACNFLLNLPGVDAHVSQRLVAHLQMVVGPLSIQVPNFRITFSPPVSPASPTESQPSTSQSSNDSDIGFYSREATFSASPTLRDLERPHTGLLMKADTRNRAAGSCHRSQRDLSPNMWRPW